MRSTFAMMLVLAALCSAPVDAQAVRDPMVSLPSASRAALTTWLHRDCSQGLTQADVAQLRGLGGDVVSALAHAFERGLPQEEQQRLRAQFESDFDKRAATLAEDGDEMFGPEAAARLRKVDKASYVRRRMDSATLNYRTNALFALGARGGPEARALLARVGETGEDDFRVIARQALQSMERNDFAPR